MKKSLLVLIMSVVILLGGLNILKAQEQPAPKKDTVNMDTHAKPEFYYATEDEESAGDKKSTTTIIIIVIAVVVVAGVAVMLLRKKK